MDPLTAMMVAAIFTAAFATRHVVDGKAVDFHDAQQQRREQIARQHPGWSAGRIEAAQKWGARRNAIGHLAYQLRHGWFPALRDLRDGFRNARAAHDAWLEERGETRPGRPSLIEAIAAGWKHARAYTRKIATRVRNQEKVEARLDKPSLFERFKARIAKLRGRDYTPKTRREKRKPAAEKVSSVEVPRNGDTNVVSISARPARPVPTGGAMTTNSSAPSGEYAGWEAETADWSNIQQMATQLVSALELKMSAYAGMNADAETINRIAAVREKAELTAQAASEFSDHRQATHGAVKEAKDATGAKGDESLYK